MAQMALATLEEVHICLASRRRRAHQESRSQIRQSVFLNQPFRQLLL